MKVVKRLSLMLKCYISRRDIINVRIYCSGAVVSQLSVAFKEIEIMLSSSDVATDGSDCSSCSGWCSDEDGVVFLPWYW